MAILATLVPAQVHAFAWGARGGVEYERQDAWSASRGARSARLDINLGLNLQGFVGRPGILNYTGGVNWKRLTISPDGAGDTVSSMLNYNLRSAVFSDPRSPVTLALEGSRRQDELDVAGASALDRTTTSSWAADALLKRPDGQSLALGYQWSEVEQEGSRIGHATRRNQVLSATTGIGGSIYTCVASYRGLLSSGTFTTDNRNDHRVDVKASVNVAENLVLDVSDSYFLRLPTEQSLLNPRQEQNDLTTRILYRGSGSRAHSASYRYTNALQAGAAGGALERESQLASYSLDTPLHDPEWSMRGGVAVSYSRDSLGGVERKGTGQELSAAITWRRVTPWGFIEGRGGPSLGLLQPSGGGVEYGYGASAGAAIARRWGATQAQVVYDVQYARNLGSQQGWGLRQGLSGSLNGPFALGAARGQLIATAERNHSPILGDGASRSLTAIGGYARGRYDLQLNVSLSEGLTGSLSGSSPTDGLFLPAPYDSRSLNAFLEGSARLTRYLSARGQLRVAAAYLPDRPTVDEKEIRASLEFSYGALGFSLEERFIVTDPGSGAGKVNQVWVRAYRVFGSRL